PLLSRREALRRGFQAAAGLAGVSALEPLLNGAEVRRYKIGACDWSLGKMDDPGAFELAREIGLDGVQVSLGTAANDMHLRQAEVQARFKQAAKLAGVEVASLA